MVEFADLHPPFVLVDARVWPGDMDNLGAVYVRPDGTIGAVGATEYVLSEGSLGPIVSVGGCWVTPGFIDPHVHIRAAASARASVDVSHVQDINTILGVVRRVASSTAPEDWISLWGLRHELLQGRTRWSEELDRVADGRPVRIRHRSTHAWIFSTRALNHLAIHDGLAPAGVFVERDDRGDATGFVIDHSGWVGEQLGRITPAARLEAEVSNWSLELATNGIVAIVDATARNSAAKLEQLETWSSRGVIIQRLAAMMKAGEKPPPSSLAFAGHKVMSPDDADDLREAVLMSWANGIGVAIHCVEPAELGVVIEAIERIPPSRRGRLRIEHASFCPPEWVPRIKCLGATVVTHPAFVYAHGDRYLSDGDLQPHEWLYRLASWVEAGVPLAFSSDAPAGPFEPLLQLRSACTRRTKAGVVLGPMESLSLDQALWAATVGAAQASGIDDWTGALVTHSNADLVVISPGSRGLIDNETKVEVTLISGIPVA